MELTELAENDRGALPSVLESAMLGCHHGDPVHGAENLHLSDYLSYDLHHDAISG